MSRYLISGYYGRNNIGDEAILSQTISSIRKIDAEAKISCLSYYPENTKMIHNINSFNVKKPVQIFREIIKTDYFIYGGGGHEFTNNLLSVYIISTSMLASLLKKKVIAYAIGIEKNPNKKLLPMIRFSYNHFFNLIMVRDSKSKEIMKSWGIREEKINVTSDPVFNYSLDKVDKETNVILERILKFSNGSKLVGVNFNNKEKKINLEEQKMIIDTTIRNGFKVVLIPMCLDEGDIEIVNNFENEYYNSEDVFFVKEILRIEHLYEIVSCFTLTIGMRFHFLIFSALSDVPFIALSNSNKVITLTDSLEQSNILNFDIGDFPQLIERSITAREHFKEKLTLNIKRLKDEERNNSKLLRNL